MLREREKLTIQTPKLAGKCPVTDCCYEHWYIFWDLERVSWWRCPDFRAYFCIALGQDKVTCWNGSKVLYGAGFPPKVPKIMFYHQCGAPWGQPSGHELNPQEMDWGFWGERWAKYSPDCGLCGYNAGQLSWPLLNLGVVNKTPWHPPSVDLVWT